MKDFSAKAKRLDQLSFTKYVRENKVGFSVSAEVDKDTSVRSAGPEQESTEAFALTLRLSLQPNEPLSLDRFSGIFSKLPVSAGLIAELMRVDRLINEFLGRPCDIGVNGRSVLNREVLDVFIYGGLARTTRIREFEAWQANPVLFGMLQLSFYGILIELPEPVRMTHLAEIASSNFIFGMFITWLLTERHKLVNHSRRAIAR